MENSPKVLIETYGCQMNVADSELIQGILSEAGFGVAQSLEDADVIMLNTCAVREKAEARILGRLTNLLPFKRSKPGLLIGVVGCMAKHLGQEIIDRLKYVDFVVGPDNYRKLPEILKNKALDAQVAINFDKSEYYSQIHPKRPTGVTAWLTIQRGCNYVCTYCIVPFTRGCERYVPAAELIEEARKMAEEGYKVITLLGQTVNSYHDGNFTFADLCREIAKIDGIEQIRFTSPHPLGFSDDLIHLIATEPKMAKFVHLPLQSASDDQLKLMRRGYTFEDYCTIVRKLREECPEIAISTDIIVGFCGETEQDYQKTLQAMKDLRFDFAFLFAYSERSLSIAARTLKDDIDPAVKQQRLAEIIDVQQAISKEKYQAKVGKRLPVLVEGYSMRDEQFAVGNTTDFKTTLFPRQGFIPGDWVEVEIEEATSQTLKGKPIRLIRHTDTQLTVQSPIEIGISIGPMAANN